MLSERVRDSMLIECGVTVIPQLSFLPTLFIVLKSEDDGGLVGEMGVVDLCDPAPVFFSFS